MLDSSLAPVSDLINRLPGSLSSVLAEQTDTDPSLKPPSAASPSTRQFAQSSRLFSSFVSNSGLVRAHNEDRGLINASLGLCVLADGMGGYNAGEVASQLAVDEINRYAKAELANQPRHESPDDFCLTEQAMARAMLQANAAILSLAHKRPECLGMGTTAVAIAFAGSVDAYAEQAFTVAHVGDSRCYVVGKSNIRALTKDHSVGQELIDRGVMSLRDLRQHSMRGVLTRALGVETAVTVDTASYALRPGEVILLCSDGLTDLLEDGEIIDILGPYSRLVPTQEILEQAGDALVQAAIFRGGFDNVSALIVARA